MTRKKSGRPGQRAQTPLPETPPATVLLTTWTSVYPLSRNPAERIARDVDIPGVTSDLESVVAEYVRTINSRLHPELTMDVSGNVTGPSQFVGDPALELLAAVLQTDVDAILARHQTRVARTANLQ